MGKGGDEERGTEEQREDSHMVSATGKVWAHTNITSWYTYDSQE